MRYVWMMLVAGVLSFSVTAQAAGTTKHKTDAFSITLPSDWPVAPAEVLTQFSDKVKQGKLIMMAGGQGDAPQMTALVQTAPQDSMTQASFIALDDKGVQAMCAQMTEGAKLAPGASDISCSREKTAKGTALVTNLTLTANGNSFINTNWTFYTGKDVLIVSALYDAKNKAKVAAPLEKAFKSIELK